MDENSDCSVSLRNLGIFLRRKEYYSLNGENSGCSASLRNLGIFLRRKVYYSPNEENLVILLHFGT
jgi:hypothetical protein